MKKLKEELKYGKKGITLISLVVTIIVLLILAGVTIATLTGENGILSRATESKNKTEKAQEKESLELAVTSSQMEDVNTLKITEEKLSDAIKQQFGNNKDFSITDNGDGSFLVSMNDTQRMYYIDETGEVIDQSKMLKISTDDELKAFRDDVNSGNTYEDWYVYLTNDITLDISEEWKPIGLYPNDSPTLDSVNNKPFKGIFDGCNYEILNINVSTDNAAGLFAYIKDATIKNVTVNGEINSDNYRAGGIIAMCEGKNYIYNCHNNSSIKSLGQGDYSQAGGIIGNAEGHLVIANCSNRNSITAFNHAGGIIARANAEVNILNCYNSATITTNGNDKNAGGIIGSISSGNNINILSSYNTGNVEGTASNLGGIIGYQAVSNSSSQTCNIEECHNSGEINNKNNNSGNSGGIAGSLASNSKIKSSYNTGNIIANGFNAGGIIASVTSLSNCNISNTYNSGAVTLYGTQYSGGIIGYVFGGGQAEIENCYNTGNITSTSTSAGGICGMIYTNKNDTSSSENISTLKINSSYNIGIITGTIHANGIIGIVRADSKVTLNNCYYLSNMNLGESVEDSDAIIGSSIQKTRSQMVTAEFIDLLNNNKNSIWIEDLENINNNYPILYWQK